jgi:hypothetical protein
VSVNCRRLWADIAARQLSAIWQQLFCDKMSVRLKKTYLSVANPTIASYNTSVVKIYNATSSLVRLGNQNFYLYTLWKTP